MAAAVAWWWVAARQPALRRLLAPQDQDALRLALGLPIAAQSRGWADVCAALGPAIAATRGCGRVSPRAGALLAASLASLVVGARSAVLLDEQFPPRLATDPERLAAVVALAAPGLVVIDLRGSATVVARLDLLLARLALARQGMAQQAIPHDMNLVDVTPGAGLPRIPARPLASALAGLERELRASRGPLRRLPCAWLAHDVALVPVVGWLLEYPVQYAFGQDLACPAQANALSGAALLHVALRGAHEDGMQLVSFTLPLGALGRVERCLAARGMRRAAALLADHGARFEVVCAAVTLDHVSL